jgi:hypothetical protein
VKIKQLHSSCEIASEQPDQFSDCEVEERSIAAAFELSRPMASREVLYGVEESCTKTA